MFRKVFRQVDGPTWIVALVIYAAWGALIWYNAALPWWFMMPVGAYLLAWLSRCTGVVAICPGVSTDWPVVSLSPVPQEPYHSSSRH
jgi:hypothetical protein